MLKKINDILAGIPMTAVAGVFLVLSFVLPRIGVELPVDPAWVTVVISGIPLLYLAVWRVIHNPGISKISSALLITIAMFAAIAIGDLFAAGEVVFIMAIGAILEDMTTERARKGLKQLISLAPVQGRKIENGQEMMIPVQEIRSGDLLRILPGETVPVDGVIVSGETSVDQSVMTGESLPVDKSVGEEVFCGTVNRFGVVDIRATKVGQDSSLQKLIRMVQEAEEKKAPMARIADKAASFLVPVALLIAVAAGLVTGNIVRAVTVLVVFCPCALVLATPTAVMASIGQATKHGVIIKSGEALEKMGKVDTIAFDKTGTLTRGCLEVSDILTFDSSLSENELLRLAASAESRSEHPLGKAITACAGSRSAELVEPESFHMDAGKGVCAQVSGRMLYCGSEKYLAEHGIFPDEGVKKQLERLRSEGKASILIAEKLSVKERAGREPAAAGGRCIGVIAMSDVLREEAADMIRSLHSLHTDAVLLTGDSRQTADWFAKRVGINEVHAELLPEEKVALIEKMQAEGRTVCMIGDGVNDAPALKTAGVGAAMGSMGSDIAVEAADIALMSDDLSQITYLKRLARETVKTIRFSITLSMCINFLAVTCSVLGLLTPTTGALVHNAGSCLVVLIAALLYDRKFEVTVQTSVGEMSAADV
ncbi:MAG: cation-translocating P-type ATPase [Lachnospiraceae bacterium]|nr:cation-translocating P-type ATPase [Lachnospiraceae bacterium]